MRFLRNILAGMGSIPNLWPAPRPRRLPAIEDILSRADSEALADDWRAIGDDMRKALGIAPMSNDRLLRYAEKNRPPQSWYDEDVDPFA